MTPAERAKLGRLQLLWQGELQKTLQQQADAQRLKLARLRQWQEGLQKSLARQADLMSSNAEQILTLPQDKWDRLFASWEQTSRLVHQAVSGFEQALRDAGVDVSPGPKGPR